MINERESQTDPFPMKNSDFDYHDGGPYPNGTIALMKAGDPGRWMRHEDWRKANEQAKAKMQ